MITIEAINNQVLLKNSLTPETLSLEWFDPQFWQDNHAIVGQKSGRATAWFFKYRDDSIAVLKRYYRGGLIGKLLSDQYLYLGMKATRVYKEFQLLSELQLKDLPVPTPLCARIEKKGMIYKADMITAAIPGAQSLCERIQQRSLCEDEIALIAKTIAQFHKAGVYHDDLNINNILFSGDERVFLIDFDKGDLRVPESKWQQANLERLQRSFKKEAGKWPTFHFAETDFECLLSHYRNAIK